MKSVIRNVLQSLLQLALGSVATGLVMAAGETSGEQQLQEVIITGSRIQQPNQVSTSPIQVVTAEEIRLGGKTDISDLIQALPQNFNNTLGQDLGNRTSGLSTAGGVATADLRGLGPHRTLVLVDGRRLGSGSPNTAIQSPAPDLDQIPAALIERVEVVTGGASAVYGSDAIAGVVNFIMKKSFEGLQIDYQTGLNWHQNHNSYATRQVIDGGFNPITGSNYDGHNQAINVIAGANLADDKGNVTAYVGYLKSKPVRSGDRDFGACQLFANANLDGVECGGSTNSNQFRLTGTTADYSVSGSSFVPFDSTNTSPPGIFNSQRYIYMGRDNERYNAGFMAHMDLNEVVRPYVELTFMNDRSVQEIAPSGLFKDSNPLDPVSGNYNINCSNPLLSAQQASILCTPAQVAADRANPGSVSANVRIGRRNTEGGGRVSYYEHTNYRAVLGANGDLGAAWNYDLYGQYYYTTFFNSNDRYLNFQAISNALQVTGTAANPLCISGAPCVPYNIFREGGVTQQQLQYLYLSGTAYGSTSLRTVHADVTGDLGTYNLKSPLARDGLAINIGYEQRAEQVKFQPDSGELSGLLSGFGGAQVSIDNGYSVNEQFIELRAPLVQDRPGIKELLFDTGYRRSDYSTAGAINTYKFEVQYAPVDDLRVRGSYQRAIRAPTIIELFNPQLVGQAQLGDDPCAPTTGAGGAIIPATATLAQCRNTGVTAAQYGNGGTTNLIPQGTAGQLTQLQGGNPRLQAETADTYSLGVTINPRALPNLTASIDYFDVKLEDAVGVIPANIIIGQCLTGGDPRFCSQIVRSNTGGLTGNNIAGGGYILQTNVNIGAAEFSGIDLQGAYRQPIGNLGSLSFAMNGAYLLKTTNTPLPGSHTYDCAGLFGSTCQTVTPRWRHVLRISWETPWEVVISANWRFMGSVSLDNNDSDPSLLGKQFQDANGNPAYNYFNASIPAYSYLDLSASWSVTPGVQLRAGINNIMDKDPPLVSSEIISGGGANTYEAYDMTGRQVFMSLTAKF